MRGTAAIRELLWPVVLLLILAALVIAGSATLPRLDWEPKPAATNAVGIESVMRAQVDGGFARARVDYAIEFPKDHGAHPAFRSEWWYVVGNLVDAHGRRYGYQTTLFRFSAVAKAPPLDSSFADGQYWMAHVAFTDIDDGIYRSAERFARAGPGVAGATTEPLAVWVEDLGITGNSSSVCDGCLDLVLDVKVEDVALRLDLTSVRPLVRQGENGFSAKTVDGLNASHYYSMTRLETRGEIRRDGTTVGVTGTSWFDREWSTSALGEEQVGWDWFALHLDDGRDLMVYRMRRRDGTSDAASAGIVVDEAGVVKKLDAARLALEPTAFWTSEDTGTRYPIAWRVVADDIVLDVKALVNHQEHQGQFRYWEGAVGVFQAGDAVGVGYLEMTGY